MTKIVDLVCQQNYVLQETNGPNGSKNTILKILVNN